MKIAIASDHRGYELKEYLKKNLRQYDIIDLGTNSEKAVDYPDYAFNKRNSNIDYLLCAECCVRYCNRYKSKVRNSPDFQALGGMAVIPSCGRLSGKRTRKDERKIFG